MQWIKMSEKTPEINQWCLCYFGNKVPVMACYKDNNTFLDDSFQTWEQDEFTHWMPIPEPPKPDKK